MGRHSEPGAAQRAWVAPTAVVILGDLAGGDIACRALLGSNLVGGQTEAR